MTGMTDPLVVLANERGVIRLFALNMPPEQARFLAEPGAADQMLGVANLDPDQIDLIAIDDLEELGLTGYLIDGFAISSDQIYRAKLKAITGYVLLVRSHAFYGQPATLQPAPELTLIATYQEPSTDWSAEPMPTASAKPRISPRAGRSEARRIGATLFGVMMLLIGIVLIVVLS
jgi:hypothetical protein